MIEYDPHHWNSHLLDIRGSMVREIFARVFTCVMWSAIVVTGLYVEDFYVRGHGIAMPPERSGIPLTAHTLLGVALSLLLVFRTNSSYDRFWEGRKLWGAIVNETRNLGRMATVHLSADIPLRNVVIRWTIAWAYASMHRLRKGTGLGEVECRLDGKEVSAACRADHVPLDIACRITGLLRRGRERGLISDFVMVQMDQNVQLLIDYLGGCERIHKTPLPFAYMVHLRRAIILYAFTLPFALYKDFGMWTVGVTFLVAFFFYGIEEIGVTIEDPFEGEDNDLPLDDICRTINRNLSAMIDDEVAPAPKKVSPPLVSDAATLSQ